MGAFKQEDYIIKTISLKRINSNSVLPSIRVPQQQLVKNFFLNVVDSVFGKLESFLVLLKHDYFNEVEAAMYLRLESPQTIGRETVRNYALRSKKLSFIKIGRTGLIFSRKDLEKFIESQRSECFRDLHY